MEAKADNYQSTAESNGQFSKRHPPNTAAKQESGLQNCCNDKDFTVEDAVTQTGFGKFQILIAVLVGVMYMSDSMEFVVASILGPELRCDWGLSAAQQALMSSFIFIGFCLGGPALGRLADVHGRKASILFGVSWSLYFGILSAWAPNLPWLLALRGLYGFGIGNTFQIITYYAEFLPPKNRGKRLALMNTWWALGASFEVVLAIGVLLTTNWNWWLMSSIVPLAVLLPFLFWLPESPRYDIVSGRTDRALKTLQRLAQTNKASLPSGKLLPEQRKPRGKFKDLFGTRQQARVTVLCCVIWSAAGFLYYSYILISSSLLTSEQCTSGYVPSVDQAACDLECSKLKLSDYVDILWISAGELVAGILTALVIDTVGRKNLMIFDSALLTVVGFVLCMCPGRTAMTVLLFFARAGTASLTLIIIMFVPEAHPTHIRALALGTATGCSKAVAATAPIIAQILWSETPRGALGIFTGLSAVCVIASALLPFDTTQKAMSVGRA